MGFGRRIRGKLEHRWARRHLPDYLDGALSEGELGRLLRHADLCPECGPMLRTLVVLLWELRELGQQRPRVTVAGGVIQRIRAEPLGMPECRRPRRGELGA